MKKTLLALLVALFPVLASPADPGDTSYWFVQHTPAAATAATISVAASPNGRHVAKSVTVCISATAAQPSLNFVLRDGATGAGTILWSARLMAPLGYGDCLTVPITIAGTKNTAMTLESAAAPAATNFATVSLNGYTTY